MQPLDVVKTRLVDSLLSARYTAVHASIRFQIQGGADDATRYNSVIDCIRKMIRNEGYEL